MKILNSKGEEIVLNGQEKKIADYNTKLCNALGHEVDITTMTLIQKQQIDQKFFTVRPSDFFPVKVGEGAFSTSLLTYKSYDIGDDFEKGFINTGANNSKLSSADAGVEAVTNKIFNWGKEIGYNIIELAQASRSGNWDLVAAKERSRKRNYDLGVQKIFFEIQSVSVDIIPDKEACPADYNQGHNGQIHQDIPFIRHQRAVSLISAHQVKAGVAES